MASHDWRERLFGKTLVKCDSPEAAIGQFESVSTKEALQDCGSEEDGVLCGVYFSFANISEESDDFPKRLEAAYAQIKHRLKIVQVVLWAHGTGQPGGLAEREAGFRESVAGKPWFAVPFHDVDTKRRLTRKFGIAVGVPALALWLGARTRHVRDALMRDPAADLYPWSPPSVHEVLRDVQLVPCPVAATGACDDSTCYADLPENAVRAFYFAAHWCPPCRSFASQLAAGLRAARRRPGHAHAQLILVSSDRSEESFQRTCSSLSAIGADGTGSPALAVSWNEDSARSSMATALGVAGIPALVLLDSQGRTLCDEGRTALTDDPNAWNFPWEPRHVTVLTEQSLHKMSQHPAIVLFIEAEDSELEFAESVLQPAAESYYEECSIQYPGFCPYQSASSDDESIDFDYPIGKTQDRTKRKSFKHMLFFIGVEGTMAAELLRAHVSLPALVPRVVAVDAPRRRLAAMALGAPITAASVQNFLDDHRSGHHACTAIEPFARKC